MPPLEGSEVGCRRMPDERCVGMSFFVRWLEAKRSDQSVTSKSPLLSPDKAASRILCWPENREPRSALGSLGLSYQAVHFLLVDFDLPFLLQTSAQVLYVESFYLLAFLLQQRVFGAVPILLGLLGSWLL